MNKAIAAGIGVGIVLIAIAALYMMNQTDESNTQVDLSEDVEIAAEESKSSDTLVVIEEGVSVGDKPP
jgi:L-ribulose-5-phosphate 3-epimerase UlaE